MDKAIELVIAAAHAALASTAGSGETRRPQSR
jgi:hypothetical protein